MVLGLIFRSNGYNFPNSRWWRETGSELCGNSGYLKSLGRQELRLLPGPQGSPALMLLVMRVLGPLPPPGTSPQGSPHPQLGPKAPATLGSCRRIPSQTLCLLEVRAHPTADRTKGLGPPGRGCQDGVAGMSAQPCDVPVSL